MRTKVELADHIIFRALPFCGVLLDLRDFHAYRLSWRAARALRAVLYGPQAARPYVSLIKDDEAVGSARHEEVTLKLLQALHSRGMVRIVDSAG